MKVLAFDIGGTAGWASATDGVLDSYGEIQIAQKGDHRVERFSRFSEKLKALIPDHQPDYVIYERPFCRGIHATRCLWGYAAIIELVAQDLGLPSLDQVPGPIKKFATGSGNAKKDDMIRIAKAYSLDPQLHEHEADAIMLAIYASQFVEVEEESRDE